MYKNNYPDYVNLYKPKGTIVKKVNNTYYVYEATSKRVEGKKYPVQIVKGVIGKIDENGFHNTEKVIVDEPIVRECGFTNYLLLHKDIYLFDKSTDRSKKDKETIFYSLICYLSNNSYLFDNKKVSIYSIDELIKKYKISLGKQIKTIETIIEHNLSEIEDLKYICRVYIGHKELKTKINNNQKKVLNILGVTEDEIR